MKTHFPKPLRLGLALTGFSLCAVTCPTPVFSQAPAPTAAPPAPVERSRFNPAVEPGANRTLPIITIPSGTIASAVGALVPLLEHAKLPELNIVYGPKADEIPVPELVLKNVSGPDALRLVAASAGCELEPISGVEGRLIGFRFAIPKGSTGVIADRPPTMGKGPSAKGFAGGMAGGPPAAMDAAPAGVPAMPSMKVARPAAGMGMPGGGMGSVIGFGGDIPPAPTVSVYGLGSVTNATKFADVESTLREVLKADGVPADAAKLAVHERTNVLIVTGEPRVHELVSQLLEALKKNAAAGERQSGADQQKLVELMIRFEAEREQRQSLNKKLDDTEAQLREAQRAIERMKATGAKP